MTEVSSSSPLLFTLAEQQLALRGHELVEGLGIFLETFGSDSIPKTLPKTGFTVGRDDEQYVLESSGSGEVLFRADTEADFLLLFDRILIDAFMEEIPPPTVLIHAASFEVEGTLCVFPGRGGAGKTTLSEDFIHRTNWTFLSDELLAVDPAGRTVYPFPHPLNLKSGPRHDTTRTLTVTDSSGTAFTYGVPPGDRVSNDPVPIEKMKIYELERGEGLGPGVRSLSVSAGLQRLFSYSTKPNDPSERFRRITKMKAFNPDCYRLLYGDCSELDPADLVPTRS